MSGNPMRRAGLTVLLGSGLGFGITFLLTPVITRLYDPRIFGEFSTVVAAGSVMVGISTFRLEVLAQGEPQDREARALFGLATVSMLTWTLLATLAGVTAALLGAPAVWSAVGVIVLSGSAQLVGTAIYVRARRYRMLGMANLVQGAGTGLLQVALGAGNAAAASLIAGFAVPRAVWLAAIRRAPSGEARQSRRSTWRENRRYGVTAGASALVNSLAGQGLVLLAAAAYGGAAAGVLAMALRVLIAPLTIVGQAAAAAGIGEVGRLIRDGEPADHLVRRGTRDLVLVGALPCVSVMILGPHFAPVVLGDRWADVGAVVAWLAVGGLAQFAVAPYSQILNMAEGSRQLLRWDVLRLLVMVASVLVPAQFGAPLWVSAAAFSVAQVVLYGWLYRLVTSAVAQRED